jgi:hypothetical protein
MWISHQRRLPCQRLPGAGGQQEEEGGPHAEGDQVVLD